MLYMIELRFTDDNRQTAIDYFWKHGMNNYEGRVSVKHLWVATQDRLAYAVVSANDAEELDKACAPLSDFVEFTVRPVISSDEL